MTTGQVQQNNRISAVMAASANKNFVSPLDPQSYKNQQAPSSSRLKQRSNIINSKGINQIDMDMFKQGDKDVSKI